jgi:hypothetical protein
MPILETSPFSALTFIAAPAILTNAASIMALGTSNRFARVIDRGRSLAQTIKSLKPDDKDREVYLRMLSRNERRGAQLVRSLRGFYFSLGCFAAASLISLLGVAASAIEIPYVLRATLFIAFLVGTGGVSGLVTGCVLLVHETTLALANLRDESDCIRRQAEAAAK